MKFLTEVLQGSFLDKKPSLRIIPHSTASLFALSYFGKGVKKYSAEPVKFKDISYSQVLFRVESIHFDLRKGYCQTCKWQKFGSRAILGIGEYLTFYIYCIL